MFAQLLRFVGVGGVATLVHVVMATLAHQGLGAADLWANLVGFCCSVLVSYLGHSRITFAVTPDHERYLPKFVFVSLSGLAASSLIVWLVSVVGGGSFLLAMILVAFFVPLATFVALRFWVFTHRSVPFLPTWPMVVTTFGAAFIFMAAYWNWPINHDTAWYLIATRKMLDGAQLYVDIVEVNPPLNFYLTMPAIWIADALRISDTNGQYLAIVLLYMISLLWTGAVLRRSIDVGTLRGLLFFVGIAAAYMLPAAVQVGQREHLLVLFMSPWLIGHLSGSMHPQSIPRSVFAAIGICIKPFFLIFPLVFALRDIVRTRSIKPIFSAGYLSMLFVGVAYVALTMVWHPEYLNEIAPMASNVYGAYKRSFFEIVTQLYFPLAIGLAALLPSLVRGSIGASVFGLATLAALVSFFVQSTGFGYHLVPYFTYALLGGAWYVLTTEKVSVRLVMVSMACALMITSFISRGRYRNSATYEVVRVAYEIGPVDGLFAASTILDPGAPAALRLGIDWDSRYPTNWLYPGALNALATTDCSSEPVKCRELSAIIDKNRDDNIEDILQYDPDLIVVDRSEIASRISPLPWIDFMSEDPRFAKVIENYTLVKSTDRMDYFLRKDE